MTPETPDVQAPRKAAGEPVAPQRESICNIASSLPQMAATVPEQAAIVLTAGRGGKGAAGCPRLTFAELEALSNRYAGGLCDAGIERGMRTLLMVRPGFEFFGLTFALFKIGAVPVLIDPGMGVRQMLRCVRNVEPQALIGIPPAQAMRVLRPAAFQSVRRVVTVGRRWFWGGPTLGELAARGGDRFEPAATTADEVAAVLFTSGSTGPAKGVVYEHGMFAAQVRWLQSHYGIEAGEIDLPAFPLFALFDAAMGMTAVIPDMDPSHPARVDPAKIVQAIHEHGVTNTFGSPAIWNRVSAYCVQHGLKLPSIRRILIAGAPVPLPVLERLGQALSPTADVHTPYGATEALPVSSITGREVLEEHGVRSRTGAGTCVGRPLPEVSLRVIRISDDPIEQWSDDLALPAGQTGEFVVAGDMVTREYHGLPRATALAKIRDGDTFRHRMGDVGYVDETGRLWFCGRKAHRVVTAWGTMFTVPCEAVFNEHPDVFRSALVGVGRSGEQRPVLVVEPEPGRFPRGSRLRSFARELLDLGRANELTRDVHDVLFHRGFPVDVRHNAKINREKLAVWAEDRLR
ncbi:MAG TPA: fatty acid CoA ligase family protein [Phycisphaerae bacterium]|nr:fatty acid CoA ligase family protein [Phycisphaerae bacterium]